MTRVIVVTGTDTDVGKTIATAALATTAGDRVVVVKPVQTGVPAEAHDDADATTVLALAGCPVQELTRLDDPLAPDVAARRQGVRIPPVEVHAAYIRTLANDYDTIIVEGSGGLLVRLDLDGGTLLDLTVALRDSMPEAQVDVVVVARAGLGTLNHTELTVNALRARGIEPIGVVIGSWPASPGLAETTNRDELPRVTGVPLLAVIPEGAGRRDRLSFQMAAPGWLVR
ncbi:MAG: dethiobiotin synthase [Nocardioidaceae bacterium]|nr:dethiobiotin synthase [Nocardioidaceae bacterium]MCL2612637.1 dethiobiotin synthase [Nocardioidaceae bacterium]